MKTRKNNMRFLIFLAGMLLFMPSCSKDWDWFGKDPESDGFEAYIVSFHVPYSLHAGQPAVLTVTYAKPQPCFTRTGIDTHLRGWEMEVEVWLKRDHAYACPDVLVEESAEFPVVFPLPGVYTLKYNGMDGPETLGIEVLQ